MPKWLPFAVVVVALGGAAAWFFLAKPSAAAAPPPPPDDGGGGGGIDFSGLGGKLSDLGKRAGKGLRDAGKAAEKAAKKAGKAIDHELHEAAPDVKNLNVGGVLTGAAFMPKRAHDKVKKALGGLGKFI